MVGALIGGTFGVGVWFAALGERGWWVIQLRRFTARLENPDRKALSIAIFVAGGSLTSILVGLLTHSPGLTLLGWALGALLANVAFGQHLASERTRIALQTKLLLPGFLDSLSLSIGSGLTLRAAVCRAVDSAHPLVAEPWLALAADEAGERPTAFWLSQIAQGELESQGRAAMQLLNALERGTPLQDSLSHLAGELAVEVRRELVETAARKEVQMMLPVVFGILPSVTAIALYPALTTLSALN